MNGRDRIVAAIEPILEQAKLLKSGISEAFQSVTQDPLGAAIRAVGAGLSFVKNLGIGIVQGLDGMLHNVLQDTFASLNGLGGAGLSVALLSLFFVPAGIPMVIAGFLPLLIAGLSNSGMLEKIQSWLSGGFSAIVDQIDQRFGRQEALHRLIDVLNQFDKIVKGIGASLSNLVDNVLIRVGAAFSLVSPAVSAFAGGLAEIYKAGGIAAVLSGFAVQAKSLLPIFAAIQKFSGGLTTPIQAFVQAILKIASTFPVVQRLLTMLGGVAALVAKLPGAQQMVATGVMAIAGGRRALASGGAALESGKEVAVSGIQRVIQLMQWIGVGVYQISRPGVAAVKQLPVILQVLSKILGVSGKILNPLPALIALSSTAVGRDGKTPRITPIDILGRILPDFLVSGADKAVTGTKVKGVLEQRQSGFTNVDPFKQREVIGKYTDRLANPLGLLNTPLFGPAAIASIELLGGSILGLVATLGIAAAALYVFKPDAIKPILGIFRALGSLVMGVSFILMHLGQSTEKAGSTLNILGAKMAAPKWAIATSKAIAGVISGIGWMANTLVNVVDFVLGIVPTLIRSTVLLVPLAIMAATSLVLTAFQSFAIRLIQDTMVLGDAVVMGFQQGDWSALGDILKQAFINAFKVTVQPVMRLVKFLVWDMFLRPIGRAIGAVAGLFVSLGSSILDALMHPMRILKFLAAGVAFVGAAIAAIRIGTILTAMVTGVEALGASAGVVVGIGAVAAVVTGIALAPVLGILGAIAAAVAVVVAGLVLGYRGGFKALGKMVIAIQHPIDFLNQGMANLIALITTPVKPLDWLFSPILDFLSGIGKNLMKFFPGLLGAFFVLNIFSKGLVKGMVSGFMTIVKAVTGITTAIFGAIGAMVTLGRRSRAYSKTLEGQVFQESVKRKGASVMGRLGIGRPSESPAVKQEQDRQFKERSSIVKFQRKIEKLQQESQQEYGDSVMKLSPSMRKQGTKKRFGMFNVKADVLTKEGTNLAQRAATDDLKQGRKKFTDENLQAIAKQVGLNINDVPGILNLRELATAKSGKLEEVKELYSQSIENIRSAEMNVQKANVQIIADTIKLPNGVADFGAARQAKEVSSRTLRTNADVLDLPFNPKSVQGMFQMSGVGSTDGVQKIVEQLQQLQTGRGGKETRLDDISLSMVKSMAQEMGVYQPRGSKEKDYRFMDDYKDHMDKQGIPALTKQLLTLQMLAKTGQITNPEELAKGFVGPAEALKVIHEAMGNLQKANTVRDEGASTALMETAMGSLKANFDFLKNDDIGRIVSSLSNDAGPDEAMKALKIVLNRQVGLILAQNPVVAVGQAGEQIAEGMNAATAQVVQQTREVQKGAAKSGIAGFFGAVVGRVKRVRRDIRDSDTMTQMRENAQEGQRYRTQAAQSTHTQAQIASTSQAIGASNRVDFMRKIGVLEDPGAKFLDNAEQQIGKALSVVMTKEQDDLLYSTIKIVSTTAAKDVMGKLKPEALAALSTYATQANVGVETLLDAMRSNGKNSKGMSEEAIARLKTDLPSFNKSGLEDFFKQIGLVVVAEVPLDALGKKYKQLIQQKYMPDIQRIQGGSINEVSEPVKTALNQYAKDYGISLNELVDNVRSFSTQDIIQTLREAGAIQELANPGYIANFLKSANVKVPSPSVDTPQAKAALKLMRGDLSNINSDVTQQVLRMIARSANVDVSQLIDPSMTLAKTRQARPKRLEMLTQRTGADLSELPAAMGDISPYNFEAIASGKTYAVADSEIDKVVKTLKFKDRLEFEQAISAITLFQENRAGLLSRVGTALKEGVGSATGLSAIKKSQGYQQQLQQYQRQLQRSTQVTADPSPEQMQQALIPRREAGLRNSLAATGTSQKQFTNRLKDLGLNDIFRSFMQTGEWVQRASAEQLEILYKEGFAQEITPARLEALRKSLKKQNVTDVFTNYLENGRFINADAKKQEKVMNALKGTIGAKIGEQELGDIQHLLKDNELTALVSAYLKTGEFVTAAADRDKQAIAAAVMGVNSTIEELNNLHLAVPEGKFGHMKVQLQLFTLGLSDRLSSLGEAISEGLGKTPLRPVSRQVVKSFQTFQNQFQSAASSMKTQISASPIGKNIAAAQQDYRKARGRSLQGMTETAGFGSLEEFVTAFRARLQQRDVPQQDIDQELLAVLKPDKKGLRAVDQGGMNVRQDTLKVMSELLGLAGSDRERLASAGGYTTDAVDPVQVYFIKRLPKILLETTGSVMGAAAKAVGRAGMFGMKAAIRRFSPDIVKRTALFARSVGFGLSTTVNRIRESLAGTPLSKLLLPLEDALDLSTRRVGRFLDHQAEAIAQAPPPIPIVERVKSLFQSLSERFNQVVEAMRQGINAASSTASNLFAPLRNILGSVFGMMSGAFQTVIGKMRAAASKVASGAKSTIGGGMMGRYRQSGGLSEVEQFRRDSRLRPTSEQNFVQSYGPDGIQIRSAKGNPAGRFLDEQAISIGDQRALMAKTPSRQGVRTTQATGQTASLTNASSMLPDPWEESHAERFFKGIAQFNRALKRAIPEVSTQTVEFFRSINQEGDRTLKSIRVVPLYGRILSRMSEAVKGGLEGMARAADRSAGINPPLIKPPAPPPKIAGLLPPAGGMPAASPKAAIGSANIMTQAFTRSADRVRAAWARTGEEVTGNTWGMMVRRAYRTGLRILGFISEASPGPTRQIRQNYAHTADAVAADFVHMEQAAHHAGDSITETMTHAAKATKKVGLGQRLSQVGAGARKVGGAGMAIGGALGAAGFAAQSVTSSLGTLGLMDQKDSEAINKVIELFSIVTTVGGLAMPIIGAVVSTLAAAIPIIVGVGGAIFAFLVSPIGIATAAIVGAVLLANEVLKHFFGIDLLTPIVARAWGFAQQIFAPFSIAVNWIEAKWKGLRDRFGPILSPIVQPAVDVAQKLINSLNHSPTVVIPLAWENAVTGITGSIEKLPGVGSDVAEQLNNDMKPEGWFSASMKQLEQWKKSIKEFSAPVAAKPKIPLPPPPHPPH